MDLGMKTDKIALDGYDFMSRPKAGSASCYSKKKKRSHLLMSNCSDILTKQ